MRKRDRGRPLALVLALCLAVLAAVSAQAQGNSLTIEYKWGKTALSGAMFRVWKVVDTQDGEYAPVGAFAGYGLDFRGYKAEDWRREAMTLAAYADRDGIEPAHSGRTDENGEAHFSGLEDGLYLFVGEEHGQGEYRYNAEPGLVVVPGENEDGTASAAVVVGPKKERDKVGPKDIEVRKIWADDGYENERPQDVRVQLRRNGRVFETVTLNKDNNWEYKWEDLEGGWNWTVAEEDVGEKYRDSYAKNGKTIEITNRYRLPDEPELDERLPQTGVLWWPVPVLACAGMIFCAIGWRKQRGGDEK